MTTSETGATVIADNGLSFDRPLAVKLRRGEDGPELASRPLRPNDLVDLRGEMWLEFFLRRGMPDVPLEAVSLKVTPRSPPAALARCEGFVVEASGPHNQSFEREYSMDLFADTATSLAQELIIQGRLGASEPYYWYITGQGARHEPQQPALSFSIAATSEPLTYVRHRLDELVRGAETVGTHDERDMKVFYLRKSLQRAETFARQGAQQHPAVETGAVVVGTLVSCPDTGELFAVVTDALELTDAVEKRFSLAYTGQTWARARAILRARQARHPSLRMLGQGHGHNFYPADGAPPCELCSQAKVCGRTSVFVSTDDRAWTRAVLSGQPWALCHIFGFNARREEVGELFGLGENRLRPRGYYVIDHFEL